MTVLLNLLIYGHNSGPILHLKDEHVIQKQNTMRGEIKKNRLYPNGN